MAVLVTKATPCPSLVKRRADLDVSAKWEETVRIIRSCQYCKTTYKLAGDAWVCEHYHRPIGA